MAKGGFRGMPGGMNQAAMIKQAQKMQQDMLKMQQELENTNYTAAAGGGMVKVSINGKKEILAIDIKPDIVDPDDIETLQDILVAAVNQAITQVETTNTNEMGKITGGMNMPGLF